MHGGIGGGAVAPDVNALMPGIGILPIGSTRPVAGSQGGSDQDERDLFGLFHGGLFNSDKDLVILFQADVLGIAGAILGGGVQRIQAGNGVTMEDGGVFVILYPDLMTGEDDVVSAVGMLDTNGGLDGPIVIDGRALILVGGRVGRPVGQINDYKQGAYKKEYCDVSTAHGISS